MIYDDQAARIAAAIRPEHAGLTEAGRRKFSLLLALACNWSAGDALAGSLLRSVDASRFAETLKAMGLETRGSVLSPLTWSVCNLDRMAAFLLTPEMAEQLKFGALSGRGF